MLTVSGKGLVLLLPWILLGLQSPVSAAPADVDSQSTTSSSAVPIVNLGYAQYQGVPNTKGNTDFLGIRYAAPPVGNLRFREPQAPATVKGVQVANKQPNICSQGVFGANSVSPFRGSNTTGASTSLTERDVVIPPVSEDCLFLNVVVPGTNIKSSTKRPVVVWIYGGGYSQGSASWTGFSPGAYDGNDLVKISDGKAVVVLVQYRLGPQGFLAGEEVKKNGALNAGLLDQQFALKWVQRYISNFGGDPGQVTIWGESAGAGSVLQHLLANGGQTQPPLFKQAILSSIYLPPQFKYNEQIPEAIFNDVATQAGCGSASDKLECLRLGSVDSSVLDEVHKAVDAAGFFRTYTFTPVVDGTFIRDSPVQAIQQKKINKANILALTNSNEGTLFVNPNVTSIEDYIAALLPTLPSEQVKTAASQYSGSGSAAEQAASVYGESLFICPTYNLLRALNGKVYKGEYAVPPALHGDDLFYYFPTASETGPSFNNPDFVNTFAGLYLDFAVTGKPNANRPGSLLPPTWPTWSEGSPKQVVFNRTGDAPAIALENSPDALLERCRYWDSVAESIGH
ncbi:hypothetical protein D9611_001408 [Ephemerocybe angulata]|uniref:Carboxylic ester hydrolase n=1 Tax=Ephemerocybe angulata TaxID=980116 RepID=A0A8H5FMX2_9AGAR|nr:hypothetical protein D9611_001408 [Tulosesus angulatus]